MIKISLTEEWLEHAAEHDSQADTAAGPLSIGQQDAVKSISPWAETVLSAQGRQDLERLRRSAEREFVRFQQVPNENHDVRTLAFARYLQLLVEGRQYHAVSAAIEALSAESAPLRDSNEVSKVAQLAELACEIFSFPTVQTRVCQQHNIRILDRTLAKILERMYASSAWLFVPEGEFLKPLVMRNSAVSTRNIHKQERSIVGMVWKTRKPYCAENVSKVKHPYLQLVEETKSELAVPILDSNGILQGVVNLESNVDGAFSPAQIGELEELVTDLIPYLLLRESSIGWHFHLHGWGINAYLSDLCSHVVECLRGHQIKAALAVWLFDRQKEELYTLATDGFDSEYQILPLKGVSFTGNVSNLPHGCVLAGSLRDFPEFARKQKAERMGVTWISGAPIYKPNEQRPVGSLNLYYFGEHTCLPNSVLTHLADTVGETLAAHETIRAPAAAAYCNRRLKQRAVDSSSSFDIIRHVLQECLDTETCSIFAREPESNSLVCVSSSGIEVRGTRVTELASVVYDLGEPSGGLTWYLGRHPDFCVRRNDVLNFKEPGSESGIASQNRFREIGSLGMTDRRRFLGISVVDEATKDVLGVIRLNRPTDKRPFRHADEILLRCVAQTAANAVRDWRNERARIVPDEAGLGLVKRRGSLAALGSLLKSVPTYNRAGSLWAKKILHDILDLAQGMGAVQASVREVITREDGEEELRLIAFASRREDASLLGGAEHRLGPDDRENDSAAWQSIDNRKILTFDSTKSRTLIKPISVHSNRIRSGANLPIIAFRNGRKIRGVLAIDFEQDVQWSSDDIWALFYACCQLCTVLGESKPVDFWNTSMILRTFLATSLRSTKSPWGSLLLLSDERGKQYVPVVNQFASSSLPEDWRAATTGVIYDAKESVGPQRILQLPLLSGPFESARFICGLEEPAAPTLDETSLAKIVGLWSNIALELGGRNQLLGGYFTPDAHPSYSGITLWGEHIQWVIPQHLDSPLLASGAEGASVPFTN